VAFDASAQGVLKIAFMRTSIQSSIHISRLAAAVSVLVTAQDGGMS
jgi:hypothetical protein